jgi:hypothetical protein
VHINSGQVKFAALVQAHSDIDYAILYQSSTGRCPSNVLSDFRLSEPPVMSIPISKKIPRKSDPIRDFPVFFPDSLPIHGGVTVTPS